jgi:hypothetical protein
MIEHDEWDLFESPYYKQIPGTRNELVCTEWRIEEVPFKEQLPKPKLVMTIIEVDGKRCNKRFETGNRNLIHQLRNIIMAAQVVGTNSIEIYLERGYENNYLVADKKIVRAAMNVPPSRVQRQ